MSSSFVSAPLSRQRQTMINPMTGKQTPSRGSQSHRNLMRPPKVMLISKVRKPHRFGINQSHMANY